jgi:hypothetical protein
MIRVAEAGVAVEAETGTEVEAELGIRINFFIARKKITPRLRSRKPTSWDR